MVEDTQHEDVLVMNLAHDVMLRFKDDGSCTLTSFDQDGPPLRLEKTHQLLLLDALCRVYAFPSPVEKLVRQHVVGEQLDAPPANPEGLYYNPSEGLDPDLETP